MKSLWPVVTTEFVLCKENIIKQFFYRQEKIRSGLRVLMWRLLLRLTVKTDFGKSTVKDCLTSFHYK